MASLAFNVLLDRYKQILKSYANPTDYADHLNRTQLSYSDHVLTAAEMDTLNATPVSLVAAPGAGLVNLVSHVFLKVNSTGFTAFSNVALAVRYTNGSGAQAITDVVSTVVSSATDVLDICPGIVCAPVANAAIVAACPSDFTVGTGNIQIRVYYRTVKVSEIV